ncbi:RuBisCO large subunit C-terminal-like domain-containing protein [Telmatospirillum sp.]|uniref:RuBisCO large subunit C-terminal-like domain-containing protein n=1 Tax=Telmatospirillum sp. TaxID=2079197 RepID=UPI00284A5192|nr:RuBisCO large subunit C-terminal-like domain-containing protein [Telmatospirillum sp.]MDR3438274.1 RuBisCO large subunit C-terminal-like domain-containing protein [Telmatospirillum sp.]
MKNEYDPLLFPTSEGLVGEDYIVATYFVGGGPQADLVAKSSAIAIEQSTGSWYRVPGETDEVREKYAAKVIGIYSVPNYELIANLPKDQPRWAIVRIAYPWVDFYDNIPLMLSSVIGNISSMPNLKLVDLEFPKSYVKQFKGPKFGIAGVRKYLNVPERPLLNNMIKPCTGITPAAGAKLFYEAAVGGTDWIKDDELIAGSPAFSHQEDRIKAYMDSAHRADREKGEKTLYTVNVTDEIVRLKDNAYKAIEAGANAIMVDAFGTGFSALRMLAEDPNINVPICAHTCYGGAQTVSPFQGISTEVAQKLIRLCGADITLNVAPSAKFNALQEKFIRVFQVTHSPMYHIKPMFNMIGGGVTPGMVPYLADQLGTDFIVGAGAGIHGHPMGARAGAMAFRQVIDAVMDHIDIRDAGKKHPELQAAIDTWRVYGEDDYSKLYEIEA